MSDIVLNTLKMAQYVVGSACWVNLSTPEKVLEYTFCKNKYILLLKLHWVCFRIILEFSGFSLVCVLSKLYHTILYNIYWHMYCRIIQLLFICLMWWKPKNLNYRKWELALHKHLRGLCRKFVSFDVWHERCGRFLGSGRTKCSPPSPITYLNYFCAFLQTNSVVASVVTASVVLGFIQYLIPASSDTHNQWSHNSTKEPIGFVYIMMMPRKKQS